MSTAFLLIDAQVNMFEPEPVFQSAEVLSVLKDLLERARAAGAPVVFVRHNGGVGDIDEPHAPGWPIHPQLTPMAGEVIVDKRTPDAFFETELDSVLAARGVRRLVIAGMQTDYCVDTTTRQAFSRGYLVTLAADGHSTIDGILGAEQIIAHHNHVLAAFAEVQSAAGISFEGDAPPAIDLEAITINDLSGIQSGLAEWPEYEQWLATGKNRPYWPHTHPSRVADEFRHLWEPSFHPRERYLDPPRWELGLARAFMQPLRNIPPAFRKSSLQAVKGAIDHLLQNPRNPLSTQIRPLNNQLWLYESRDLRLFYVPHVTSDRENRDRHYIFLLWLAAGVPVHNPFA